jgi:hypothetical protein
LEGDLEGEVKKLLVQGENAEEGIDKLRKLAKENESFLKITVVKKRIFWKRKFFEAIFTPLGSFKCSKDDIFVLFRQEIPKEIKTLWRQVLSSNSLEIEIKIQKTYGKRGKLFIIKT